MFKIPLPSASSLEAKIRNQYLAPQRLIARFASFCANHSYPPFKNFLIRDFLSRYPVNLSEALIEDPLAYTSFNDFFTRKLKPHARPLPDNRTDGMIISPADGVLSQYASIQTGELLQAKGQYFQASELLGDLDDHRFDAGSFFTIYLAPPDYHCIHMPINGRLRAMRYIPGRLFSVNLTTAEEIPRLFARNERVVVFFDTDQGAVAVVFVGAMIVGSIHTSWHGAVNPQHRLNNPIQYWSYAADDPQYTFSMGDLCGHFCLGSTVIVLTERTLHFNEGLQPSQRILMGQSLAHIN